MTVKAVYEDGVLKPKGPLPFKEHEEVEIDVRRTSDPAAAVGDPESFVGFLKGGIKGMPVAAHHDEFLDQNQYALLKACFRRLARSAEWSGLSPEQQLERFAPACKEARPDLQELWDDIDQIPLAWANALDYCTHAVEP